MEILRGKHSAWMDAAQFEQHRQAFAEVWMDIGTGDGRFVRHLAQMKPEALVIGIDASRENLCENARRAPANTLFVIANAEALPPTLMGMAAQLSINFPWGSLLRGLLTPGSSVIGNLCGLARPQAGLEVRLNGGALSEAGWTLIDGTTQVREALLDAGFRMQAPAPMNSTALQALPTSWAKRLAFGRDPRGMLLRGVAAQSLTG